MGWGNRLAASIAACAISSVATAQVVSTEAQALRERPLEAAAVENYASNPRELDNLWGSKVIFGFLGPDEVDFFRFILPERDLYWAYSFLSVMALTPACSETRNNYVNVAVIGPGLPAADPSMDLPFDVPAGMGVVVKENPVVRRTATRPVLNDRKLHVSWFLPQGLTEECLVEAPFTCDWSNAVYRLLTSAGEHTIAVWAPVGVPQDYALSMGFIDSGYYHYTPVQERVRDNQLLHTPCTRTDATL